MKNFFKLLVGAFALIASTLTLAEGGVVTSINGTATVQTGTGAPRTLRLGDPVIEGDTLATGPSSTVIVKFDDGQVLALSSRARLTVSTYKYNPTAKSGNILLSLVDGGMRTLTGLIGKASPEAVTYKARTATIGIRGTDVIGEIQGDNFTFGVISGQAQLQIGQQFAQFLAGFGTNFSFINPIFQPLPFSQLTFSPNFVGLIQLPTNLFGPSAPGPFTPPPSDPPSTTTNTPNSSGPAGSGGGGTASTR
jgi:hypothetical protein